MYFWKIDSLKQDLIRREVSERDTFLYVIISIGLTTAGIELLPYIPQLERTTWDYISTCTFLIIPLIGTVWFYLWNGGKAGRDFAVRYFSIGWVMLIRSLIPLFVLVVGIVFMLPVSDSEEMPTTVWEVVLTSVWYLGLYWRMAKHTRDVASST